MRSWRRCRSSQPCSFLSANSGCNTWFSLCRTQQNNSIRSASGQRSVSVFHKVLHSEPTWSIKTSLDTTCQKIFASEFQIANIEIQPCQCDGIATMGRIASATSAVSDLGYTLFRGVARNLFRRGTKKWVSVTTGYRARFRFRVSGARKLCWKFYWTSKIPYCSENNFFVAISEGDMFSLSPFPTRLTLLPPAASARQI